VGFAVARIAYAILRSDLKRVGTNLKLLHKTHNRILTNSFLIATLLIGGVAGAVLSSKQASAFGEVTIPTPTVTISNITEHRFDTTVTVTDTGSEAITDLYFNVEVFDEAGKSVWAEGGNFFNSQYTQTVNFEPVLFRGMNYTYEVRLSSFVTSDFSEYVTGSVTTAGIKDPHVASVSFADVDGKRAMVLTGTDFNDVASKYGTMVVGQLNDQDLLTCAAYVGYGEDLTVQSLQEMGIDTTYMTDDAPCVPKFDSQNVYFTDTEMTIFLPDGFDESAEGSARVANTPLFAYNQVSAPAQLSVPGGVVNGAAVSAPNTGIAPISPIAWALVKIAR
jgi:hypothetical protein